MKRDVEGQAESIFRSKLEQGEIKFDLEAKEPNYKLRDRYEIEARANEPWLTKHGRPYSSASLSQYSSNILTTNLKRNLHITLTNYEHCNGGTESQHVNAMDTTCRGGNGLAFTPISSR